MQIECSFPPAVTRVFRVRALRPLILPRPQSHSLIAPLAYLILPNLPLLLMQHVLSLVPHGYINVECLLIGLISLFLPRVIIFLLLAIEITGAIAYAICYSFQFTFGELLTSAHFTGALPLDRKVEIAGAILLVTSVAAIVAFAVPRPRSRWSAVGCILALIIFVNVIDALDGQNPYSPKDVILVSRRVTVCPWLTLAVRGHFFSSVDVRSLSSQDKGMESASAHAVKSLTALPASAHPNVVLVVVESWGLLKDAVLAKPLTAPYNDSQLTAVYQVSYGSVPFDGLTVPGEVRELCHSHLGFGVFRASLSEADACLPEMFRARGYQTHAVHGYMGAMFQRDQWYKRIGFATASFEPDLHRDGLPGCPGAFPGICDSSIPPWIGDHLLANSDDAPQFVYWVTLNSHIPVPVHPHLPGDSTCASQPDLSSSDALCSWFRLVFAVHQSIRDLALRPTTRPTVFVLVGDHAPPFATPQLRDKFSDTVVPFIVLTPRRLLQPGKDLQVENASPVHKLSADARRPVAEQPHGSGE